VWAKNRSSSSGYWHTLVDSVRGAGKNLASNSTNAEDGPNYLISALNSDGFSVNVNPNVGVNENGGSHVAWCWDAGSSTVTNTAGSISAQVRANASAGFSIVTYTGNGTLGDTFGHGLGVKPGMVIVKNRTALSEDNWAVWHDSLGVGNWMYLNLTSSEQTGTSRFNSTDPNSSVVTLGNSGDTNRSGHNYVAYCFAPVAGYSSFGSYTGNGQSGDSAPFIWTGFRPRWVLTKASSSTGLWNIHDTQRSNYNPTSKLLWADSSSNEVDYAGGDFTIDCLSNGFKARAATASLNSSGVTYVWAAFAESPFQYARAR
jgi:hypothetical protein